MKSALGVIAGVVLLLTIAQGQPNPSTAPPLEAFAGQPATHVAWSREVGRIDSAEAHAIATALTLENTAQSPDRMSGVRLDLSARNFPDEVSLGEDTLAAYKNALDEISTSAARNSSGTQIRSRQSTH
jgi:hypothetical protein